MFTVRIIVEITDKLFKLAKIFRVYFGSHFE